MHFAANSSILQASIGAGGKRAWYDVDQIGREYESGGGGAMKIGTKGDYGVRALIDLAMYGDDGPVQRAEIARRQHIPEAYLDHLLGQLRRAGFVRSTRGPAGGHQLTRPPEETCLLHVLETLEGSLAPMPCLEDEGSADICAQ